MDLQVIRHVQAAKIIREVNTEGSAPLELFDLDGNIYYAKTTSLKVPRVEVINELLCAYFAKCWELKVPDFALVNIGDEVVENFEKENQNLSNRYKIDSFKDVDFFGSEQKNPAFELDKYIKSVSKVESKHFKSPLDLIKIGIFDLWVGNKDRKPENPNILIGGIDGSFDFHPIDHSAAFAYCSDYNEVNDGILFLQDKYRILLIDLIKTFANFPPPSAVSSLKDEILQNMEVTIANLDFIFEQVPKEWGLSKRSKKHLKEFLSDQERNIRIASTYLEYLK